MDHMANWQERMRQIQDGQIRKVAGEARKRESAEQRYSQEQTLEMQKEEGGSKGQLKKLIEKEVSDSAMIWEELGISNKLQTINGEIWGRLGNITDVAIPPKSRFVFDGFGVSFNFRRAKLDFSYETAFPETKPHMVYGEMESANTSSQGDTSYTRNSGWSIDHYRETGFWNKHRFTTSMVVETGSYLYGLGGEGSDLIRRYNEGERQFITAFIAFGDSDLSNDNLDEMKKLSLPDGYNHKSLGFRWSVGEMLKELKGARTLDLEFPVANVGRAYLEDYVDRVLATLCLLRKRRGLLPPDLYNNGQEAIKNHRSKLIDENAPWYERLFRKIG